MDKLPKRRKFKDNPYKLGYDVEKNIYYVEFIDSINKKQKVEINENIYKLFNDFELKDLSQLNEYDNHIEHLELEEETLYKRNIKKECTIENIVEKNIEMEKLHKIIQSLPEIQKRRIIKYFFENKTFEKIAEEESCTKRAIKFSVDIALKKIYEKYEKNDYTNWLLVRK